MWHTDHSETVETGVGLIWRSFGASIQGAFQWSPVFQPHKDIHYFASFPELPWAVSVLNAECTRSLLNLLVPVQRRPLYGSQTVNEIKVHSFRFGDMATVRFYLATGLIYVTCKLTAHYFVCSLTLSVDYFIFSELATG